METWVNWLGVVYAVAGLLLGTGFGWLTRGDKFRSREKEYQAMIRDLSSAQAETIYRFLVRAAESNPHHKDCRVWVVLYPALRSRREVLIEVKYISHDAEESCILSLRFDCNDGSCLESSVYSSFKERRHDLLDPQLIPHLVAYVEQVPYADTDYPRQVLLDRLNGSKSRGANGQHPPSTLEQAATIA